MTAAATTGPASGPRPASSQPATGHTPRLSAERSRRNVGRAISSSSGRRAVAVPLQLMAAMMTTPRRDPQRGIAVSEDCGDD